MNQFSTGWPNAKSADSMEMEDFCAAIGKTRSLIPHHTAASGRWQSVKRMVLHGSKPKELPILPVKRSMDSQKFVS